MPSIFLGIDCVATREVMCFSAHWLRLVRFFYFSKSASEEIVGKYIYRKEEKRMPDYEKMYFELFNGVTDIIEDLKKLQQKAEENYIEAKEEK